MGTGARWVIYRCFGLMTFQKLRLCFDGLSSIFVGMEINTALADQLAHLSRLRFNADEKEAIRGDLEKMVAFVEKLQGVDTEGVTPLLHMGDCVNVLREDIVEGSVGREEALLNSPVKDGVFFKVPKVIKK